MRPIIGLPASEINASAKKGADAYLKRVSDAQKGVDDDAKAARKRVEKIKDVMGITMKGKWNNSKLGQLAKELKSFMIDERSSSL